MVVMIRIGSPRKGETKVQTVIALDVGPDLQALYALEDARSACASKVSPNPNSGHSVSSLTHCLYHCISLILIVNEIRLALWRMLIQI